MRGNLIHMRFRPREHPEKACPLRYIVNRSHHFSLQRCSWPCVTWFFAVNQDQKCGPWLFTASSSFPYPASCWIAMKINVRMPVFFPQTSETFISASAPSVAPPLSAAPLDPQQLWATLQGAAQTWAETPAPSWPLGEFPEHPAH